MEGMTVYEVEYEACSKRLQEIFEAFGVTDYMAFDLPEGGANYSYEGANTFRNILNESDSAKWWGTIDDGTNQGVKHFADFIGSSIQTEYHH
jgi:hypothetical protein